MGHIRGVFDAVDYHQFYLEADVDTGVLPVYARDDAIAPHDLIAPAGHAVCVHTGIATGAIDLEIDVLDASPGEIIDGRREWTAVSEVSFEATSPTASIRALMDTPNAPFYGPFPLLYGVGWYRVRAHALGREIDFDGVVRAVDGLREYHLLQLWKSDGPEPAAYHRIDNQWANQPPMT